MSKFATTEQTTKLNELAINMGHSLNQIMELAGYHLARFTTHRFPSHSHKGVLVVCGHGNNGGIGLVAAKHLSNAGHEVFLYMASKDPLTEQNQKHFDILTKMGIESLDILQTKSGDVILDCFIGTEIDGDMTDAQVGIIKHMNDSGKPLISLDVPSGMNADTGEVDKAAVRPDHTVCVAAIKQGVADNAAAGVAHVYDIGIPRQLYKEVDLDYPF